MIGIILLTRGNFGEKMLESAVEILGHQDYVCSFSFSPGEEPEMVKEAILKKIYEWQCPEGILILADMCGGTPCNIALSVVKDLNKQNIKCEIVSGLNLYLLISVLSKRADLSLEELTIQAINNGRKNILAAKEFFLQKEGDN